MLRLKSFACPFSARKAAFSVSVVEGDFGSHEDLNTIAKNDELVKMTLTYNLKLWLFNTNVCFSPFKTMFLLIIFQLSHTASKMSHLIITRKHPNHFMFCVTMTCEDLYFLSSV